MTVLIYLPSGSSIAQVLEVGGNVGEIARSWSEHIRTNTLMPLIGVGDDIDEIRAPVRYVNPYQIVEVRNA